MTELTAKEKQAEEFKRKFKLLKSKQRKATYLQVLEEALGNVSVAVKTCGITRQAHYNWMDSDPKFRQSVEDIAEVALDFVEGNLMKNVREGKETSTIFYLKTKGKKRGSIGSGFVRVLNMLFMKELLASYAVFPAVNIASLISSISVSGIFA